MNVNNQIKGHKYALDALEKLKNEYKISNISAVIDNNYFLNFKHTGKIIFNDVDLRIDNNYSRIYIAFSKRLNKHYSCIVELWDDGYHNRYYLLYSVPDFSKIKITKSCENRLKKIFIEYIKLLKEQKIDFIFHKDSYMPEWLQTYLTFS